MVDIHSHIVFGVDDGAKTIEDSLAMLELAAESGTTDIVATPHSEHYDAARVCLEAGRAVLVEKPFTVTAAESVLAKGFKNSTGGTATHVSCPSGVDAKVGETRTYALPNGKTAKVTLVSAEPYHS